ncbi:DUF58 domain-containing protein [Pleomorphomonas sp. JP5]|uniref:DUF58 domain-containing protein n=1 Tax=Pleomorphomonas sp. JP5 TaxID=2942998 RepID=UPI0020440765|nr:DUF58 domain-containing protein [Pleomorphomonas sp. JP5]MCM5559847.1 DUF58 domain-containing protein [Pleomorphomonas sp. JP5]
MTGHDALTPKGVASARGLAAALPDLLIEARRVAATVAAGWHGRRRAGPGEDFWQFRPFLSGEPMRGIDWRRSARDETLYVREREHENAHTVWLWVDLTPSMDFRSELANTSKRNLALTLALAIAELLARAGERVGVVGDAEPTTRRDGAEVIAMKLARLDSVAPNQGVATMRRRDDAVLISDFLGSRAERDSLFSDLAALESRVHLVEIADPVEETFPFAGRVDFVDPETGSHLTAGRAEAWREAYLNSRAEHRARLVAACRPGWSHKVARTDRPATETLIALCGQLSAPEGAGA